MALYSVLYDTARKRFKRSETEWPAVFEDNEFDIEVTGQRDLDVTAGIISTTNKVDVFENGILRRETNDYTRDVVHNRISFRYDLHEKTWVRVRVY